jgi:hypothetical protein
MKPAQHGRETCKVRVCTYPDAAALDRQGCMSSVRHQIPTKAGLLEELPEESPMARAWANQNTIWLGQQPVYEQEGIRCSRGWIENSGVRYHPHKALQHQLREGKGFRAGAHPGKPLRIALMCAALSPMGVDQNIDIRHLHAGYRSP